MADHDSPAFGLRRHGGLPQAEQRRGTPCYEGVGDRAEQARPWQPAEQSIPSRGQIPR